MTEERRRFTRIKFDAECTVEVENSSSSVELVDLSLKGALISSSSPLPVTIGDCYLLTMKLFQSDILLKFKSRLVHTRKNRYYGFEFISENIETMSHLRRLIELNVGDEERFYRELTDFCQDTTETD